MKRTYTCPKIRILTPDDSMLIAQSITITISERTIDNVDDYDFLGRENGQKKENNNIWESGW